MTKRQLKKHIQIKVTTTKPRDTTEERERHYAFGFLVGEY